MGFWKYSKSKLIFIANYVTISKTQFYGLNILLIPEIKSECVQKYPH